MLSTRTRLTPWLALSLLASTASAGTWYVDANLGSGANDGTTWTDAFQGPDGLQLALSAAVSGDQVFVADGRYLPTSGSARGVSFLLQSGIEIYGGFFGGETSPAERPPLGVAPSILDGDLAGDDGSGATGENSFHLVKGGSADATAVLDGFIVRGGNSNGTGNANKGGGILCLNASPTIRNCHFIDNRCTFGGGAGYINGGGPTFTDCIFEDNQGGSFGGAFDIASGTAVRYDRCTFIGNRAARAGALEIFATPGIVVSNSLFQGNVATGSSGGGAIWMGSGGTHVIAGCTIVENSATSNAAGGIRNQGANSTVVNTILWNNTGTGGAMGSANQIASGQNVTYSIVTGGYTGVGNLALDPQLDANWMPSAASPGIDAGNNAGVPTGLTLDLARAPRFVDAPSVPDTGAGTAPLTDIGAFEFAELMATAYCFGDGSGTACPCANAAAAGEGCATSAGSGGLLGASGSANVGSDDLVLLGSQLLPGQPALFFVGTSQVGGGNGVVFGDGLRCAGGTVVRLGIVAPDASGNASFGPGLSGAGGWLPGDTRHFQIWFRDPGGPCGSAFNLSNALSITFQ